MSDDDPYRTTSTSNRFTAPGRGPPPSNSRPNQPRGRDQYHERGSSGLRYNDRPNDYYDSNSRHQERSRRERDHSFETRQHYSRDFRCSSGHNSRDNSNDSRGQKRCSDNFRGNRGSGHGSGYNKRPRNGMNGRKKLDKPEFFDQIKTRSAALVNKSATDENSSLVLKSNFIALKETNQVLVRQYMVKFDQSINDDRNTGLRYKIIRFHKDLFKFYLYPGGGVIFLFESVADQQLVSEVDGRYYNFELKYQQIITPIQADYLQVLNVMLRLSIRAKEIGLTLIGSDHFNEKNVIEDQHNRLQIFQGYKTSIRRYEDCNMINVRQVSKLTRSETVYEFMNRVKDIYEVDRKLLGTVVITKHNNMTYKISSVDRSLSPLSEFVLNGEKISYKRYNEQRYGLKIRDDRQPLLIAKLTAKNIRGKQGKPKLVPELCYLTDLTDAERKNSELMRSIANRTRKTPNELYNFIKDFADRLNVSAAGSFQRNGMELTNDLVDVKARDISSDIVMRHKKTKELVKFSSNDGDWSESVKNHAFYKNVSLKNWFFLCPTSLREKARAFLRSFQVPVEGFGDTFELPKGDIIFYDSSEIDVERKIQDIIAKDPKFIMIAKRDRGAGDPVYKAIKMAALKGTNHPVVTQVVTSKIMDKSIRDLSFVSKIAIQVNAKLGGIPWLIDVKYEGMMVIGIDVSREKGKKEFFSAMVAHLNPMANEIVNGIRVKNGGSFFSMVEQHQSFDSVSGKIGKYFLEALVQYEKRFKTLPLKILIYRDGVNDGDIKNCLDIELGEIDRHIAKSEGYKPELGFVLINKRVNARFMLKGRNGYENPKAGTVIDSVVTIQERFDYYLVSQKVTQGTVCPTYYNVIRDNIFEGDNKAKELQKMSQNLTQNYFNWDGGVRVPSVCQYAKKLALMSSQHIGNFDSTQIRNENALYFL